MSIWYKYRKLFLSTFELSACTFGGGFVIIPLMRKKFVEELGWIEEEEMLDLTAIAQASPGAIAVNASIMLGYHIAGIPGAILAVLGTDIDSEDYESLGGLIIEHLDRLPNKGDSVKISNCKLTVIKMDEKRIDLVKVQIDPEVEKTEDEEKSEDEDKEQK